MVENFWLKKYSVLADLSNKIEFKKMNLIWELWMKKDKYFWVNFFIKHEDKIIK